MIGRYLNKCLKASIRIECLTDCPENLRKQNAVSQMATVAEAYCQGSSSEDKLLELRHQLLKKAGLMHSGTNEAKTFCSAEKVC